MASSSSATRASAAIHLPSLVFTSGLISTTLRVELLEQVEQPHGDGADVLQIAAGKPELLAIAMP